MKIHVLGPWGTYPAPGEATTGLLVETDRARVLIDCGSGVLAQLYKKFSVEDLTAVIVTHHHHDHTADLGVLIYSVLLSRIQNRRQTKLPFYMPKGSPELTRELQNEPLIDLYSLDADSKIQIAGIDIKFAKTVHAVYCLAIRMEYEGKVFVFSADSSECDALQNIARDADLFICESSMYDGQEETAKQTGHMTAPQVGRMARAASVKRLALTHYPHYGDLEELRSQAQSAYGKEVESLLQSGSVLHIR